MLTLIVVWCIAIGFDLNYKYILISYTVLLVDSELQIRLEKVTQGKMWSSLGSLLPGNAEMTRCSDTLGKFTTGL